MYNQTYETTLGDYVSIYHQHKNKKYVCGQTSDSSITSDYKQPEEPAPGQEKETVIEEDKWISPSDALIGQVETQPPFTSKIHRGFAHNGLLEIGGQVLQMKHDKFLQKLNRLLEENNEAWQYVLEQQKEFVEVKVNKIYGDVYKKKCDILIEESSKFFQSSIREMEKNQMRTVKDMVCNAHASVVSRLNIDIKEKLKKEKKKVDHKLYKILICELKKLEEYYRLLLRNEIRRKTVYINQALVARDQVYEIYLKQFEAENITTCMYVMSNERKKCFIKKLQIENLHAKEVSENLKQVKERDETLDDYHKKPSVASINKEWEDKAQKIIKLFLKFISFSLKLLPEQTTFLLELQNILVIQMNEILKKPMYSKPVLVNTSKENTKYFDIEFPKCSEPEVPCPEPFNIEGVLHPPTPKKGDSRETLPLEEELPHFRYMRKYVYARCEKFDEVKKMLENVLECTCDRYVAPTPIQSQDTTIGEKKNISHIETPSNSNIPSTPSLEFLPPSKHERFKECPLNCYKKYVNELDFPPLHEYVEFSEENYRLVKALLRDTEIKPTYKVMDVRKAMDKLTSDLPFNDTNEVKLEVGTQYSSNVSLVPDDVFYKSQCSCDFPLDEPEKIAPSAAEITTLRRTSLLGLLRDNPRLIKLFTDEWYDFVQK